MGRGKIEVKRIEDKSSRQVSFSKRRNGMMKKAHELAILCDVDVALFVFSGRNRLYEYSTGERLSGMGRGNAQQRRHVGGTTPDNALGHTVGGVVLQKWSLALSASRRGRMRWFS